ncbi:hypothetical protein MKX03_020570 [Papaver bracteatum]|nr:hypothetical protein MKX03_020570 [Papaver bracteatum]
MTSELNLKTSISNTTTWSTSVKLTVGVKMTATFGVPDLMSGSLELSSELTTTRNWGETKTEVIEVGTVKTVTVPAMHGVKGTLMATRLSYDVPFSYTQRDTLLNGTTRTTVKNDGIFTGQNGYGYQYEVVPFPLK